MNSQLTKRFGRPVQNYTNYRPMEVARKTPAKGATQTHGCSLSTSLNTEFCHLSTFQRHYGQRYREYTLLQDASEFVSTIIIWKSCCTRHSHRKGIGHWYKDLYIKGIRHWYKILTYQSHQSLHSSKASDIFSIPLTRINLGFLSRQMVDAFQSHRSLSQYTATVEKSGLVWAWFSVSI